MNEGIDEDSRDVECATNFRAFHDIQAWRRALKPWPEFFRFSQFNFPCSTDGYVKRMKQNLNKFMANYAVISVILMICTIITSFWLLLSFLLLAILVYVIYRKTKNGPMKVGSEEIPAWILYVAAAFITLPLFIYANVAYILYCAVGVSIILILIHASFYNNQSYVLPEVSVEVITVESDQRYVTDAEVMSDGINPPKRHVMFRGIDNENN